VSEPQKTRETQGNSESPETITGLSDEKEGERKESSGLVRLFGNGVAFDRPEKGAQGFCPEYFILDERGVQMKDLPIDLIADNRTDAGFLADYQGLAEGHFQFDGEGGHVMAKQAMSHHCICQCGQNAAVNDSGIPLMAGRSDKGSFQGAGGIEMPLPRIKPGLGETLEETG
jgi:hypothetical protein